MRPVAVLAALLLLSACSSRADGPPGGPGGGRPMGRMPLSLAGEPLGRMAPDQDAYAAILVDWAKGLDANHDGVLSPDEVKPDLLRFFTAVDTDGDGSINARELSDYRIARIAALRPDQPEPPPGRERGGMMGGAGEDKVMGADRNLDFRVTPQELETVALERLRALDTDRDGRTSLEEIRIGAAKAYQERPMWGGPGGRPGGGSGRPGGGGPPPDGGGRR